MKTIELRGGPSDAKRMVVPLYSAELRLADKGGEGVFVYCPSGQRTPGGLEVWELRWATGFDECIAAQPLQSSSTCVPTEHP